MNGNAKWVIGVLGPRKTVGSSSRQVAVPTAHCRCLLAYCPRV